MTVDLRFGDCLELMRDIPDESVDAIITDLPYGITACAWDTIIPFEPMWKQIKRILKPHGAFVTTASQPFTSLLVCSNLGWFRHEWIWHKNFGGNFATLKYCPNKVHESIIVFGNGTIIYNPQKQRTESAEVIHRSHSKGNSLIIRREKSNKRSEHVLNFNHTEQWVFE